MPKEASHEELMKELEIQRGFISTRKRKNPTKPRPASYPAKIAPPIAYPPGATKAEKYRIYYLANQERIRIRDSYKNRKIRRLAKESKLNG